jgi:hypothetical protein
MSLSYQDLPYSSRLVFREADPGRSCYFQDGYGRWFRLQNSLLSRLRSAPKDTHNDMIQVSFRDGLAEHHAASPFRIFRCEELLAEALSLWTSYCNPRFRELIVSPYLPPPDRSPPPSPSGNGDPLGVADIFPELFR